MIGTFVFAMAASEAIEVAVGRNADDRCTITVAGRLYDQERDIEAMERAFAAMPEKRPVRITTLTDRVPWKCVGGVIYRLQRLGHLELDFAANSPGA